MCESKTRALPPGTATGRRIFAFHVRCLLPLHTVWPAVSACALVGPGYTRGVEKPAASGTARPMALAALHPWMVSDGQGHPWSAAHVSP